MIGWAIETFVATTLLMLLVLAIRHPVRRAFGPHMAYALWLLPVLRLVLPPLPASWREQAAAPVAAMSDVITYYVIDMGAAEAPAAQAAAGSAIDWLLVVGAVWALGAAAFLGYHLIAHSRFCARLLARARVDHMVAEGRVRVIETDAAHGPLAFGIWRKYVAFPRDFSERYDAVERDLALAHELGHHVRGDLIANWVALIVLALHWFNPVAWRAFRAFRADQEMACDALVLAGRAQALRHAYGRAIVKSAHGGAVSAACHLHTINEVKGRLRMLSKARKISPIRIAAGAMGVGALSIAALGLTASGTQAAERLKDKVAAATGLDLTDVPPAPPAAPVAPIAPAAQEAPTPPDAPEAPEAPEAGGKRVYTYTFSDDGKDGKDKQRKHRTFVFRGDMPNMPEMPDMAWVEASVPDITSANCRDGDGKEMVLKQKGDGKKPRIVICTNRIEAAAKAAEAQGAMAAEMAEKSKKMGLRHALMGLRMARRQIEAQTDLSAERRAEALRGIDEAIAEIEKESD